MNKIIHIFTFSNPWRHEGHLSLCGTTVSEEKQFIPNFSDYDDLVKAELMNAIDLDDEYLEKLKDRFCPKCLEKFHIIRAKRFLEV